MERIRYIFRIVFLLMAVLLLVNLNRKTDDKGSIVEFKLKMIEKIRTDTLDSKHTLDMVVNETSKFMEESSRVKKGVHYLIGLLILFIVSELIFIMLIKRNYRRQEIK